MIREKRRSNPSGLPAFLRPLFWDADWLAVDIECNRTTIIERVLNLGDEAQLSWLKSNVPGEAIREVVVSSRRLSRKTARCWQNYYGLKEEEMRCFGMFSMNTDNLF
ncbi:MAG: hypothetical protein GX181_02155 [Synergistaceae bacterium]|nr:hypothetical protein [Synergistota bacterium]NLM70750.1 hypothetical protein [Synergistaceae bacterium]